MIQLHNLLQKVKEEKTDLTNIGSYNLPYLFTYYSIATIFLDFSITSTKIKIFKITFISKIKKSFYNIFWY